MYEQLYLKFSYFFSFFYLYKLPFYTREEEQTRDGVGLVGATPLVKSLPDIHLHL